MSEKDRTAEVGSRGRVVLPKDLRRAKGISKGDKVKIRVEKLEVEPKRKPAKEKKRAEREEPRKSSYNVFG